MSLDFYFPPSIASKMYSRVALKRHDDIVHDVEEVWRSLRRTMILLRSDNKTQAAGALRFTVGIFNFVEDIDLVTMSHLWTIFAELFQILEDFAESDRMYREAYLSIVKNYGANHLVNIFIVSHLFTSYSVIISLAVLFLSCHIPYTIIAMCIYLLSRVCVCV